MVPMKIAATVLVLAVTALGAAPIVTAEPVNGSVSSCPVPPNPVGAVGSGEVESPSAESPSDSDWLWDAHVDYVEWVLTVTPTTEELFKQADGQWVPDRVRQQDAVMDEYWQRHGGDSVPREGRAIIAGGVPGAGKTTVLNSQPGIERGRYFNVNPDDVKEVMAVRSMIPVITGLSPMEASAHVHWEASMLAKRLAERAYGEKVNVLWDITMNSDSSVANRMADLRAAGYRQIDAVFVDTPLQIAKLRVIQRWREGQERYWAGEGLGGRYVPLEIIDMSQPGEPGFSSRNQEIFYRFRNDFTSTVEYDNSGGEPIVRCVTGPRWN